MDGANLAKQETAENTRDGLAASAGERTADLDVITIGRASVDLYGQQIGARLEDAASFAKSVGGCPPT